MLTALFVAARILANPVSNLFQKQLTARAAGPIAIIGITHAILTLACLPVLAAFPPLPGTGFWSNITIAAVLAFAGNVLLVYALRSTDLSLLGPINAYKSVVSLALGIFLIGEIPSVAGAAGVALILAGSLLIVDRASSQSAASAFARFFRERGVQFRIAALGFSATEAVFLKRALLASSPLTTFLFWAILGLPVALAAAALLPGERPRRQFGVLRKNWTTCLWLAATTGIMQLATLFTFGKLPVGYSLALFQLSALISVGLGYRYFEERNVGKRFLGSAVMVAGAILIVLYGHAG